MPRSMQYLLVEVNIINVNGGLGSICFVSSSSFRIEAFVLLPSYLLRFECGLVSLQDNVRLRVLVVDVEVVVV